MAALYLVELSRNEKCPWSYDLWYNVGIQDFTRMPSSRSECVREELSLEMEACSNCKLSTRDEGERKHIFFQPLLLEVYLYELFFPFIDQFPELDDVITLLEKLEELVKVWNPCI